MASSAADLGRKFREASAAGPPVIRDTITEAAKRTKVIYIAGAAKAGLVPGRRMRGVGKKGAAWGVGYEFIGGTGADQSVVVKYRGPVHLVNNDTAPHLIMSKAAKAQLRQQARAFVQATTGQRVRRSRRSTSGPQALGLPSGPVASAKHPGTQGKNFFRPADDFARSEVTRIAGKSRAQMLRRGGFGEGI